QANAVGLLNGSQTNPTPQQQTFLNQVGQAAPQAQTQITRILNTANAAHDTAASSATVAVAQGLGAGGQTQTAALTPPTGTSAGTPGAATGTPVGTIGVAPATVPTTTQGVQSA